MLSCIKTHDNLIHTVRELPETYRLFLIKWTPQQQLAQLIANGEQLKDILDMLPEKERPRIFWRVTAQWHHNMDFLQMMGNPAQFRACFSALSEQQRASCLFKIMDGKSD